MGASMNASTPISPEQWPTPDGEWMQEHTHSAWLFGRATIPLKRHVSVDAPLHMKKLRFVYAGRFQNTLLTERAGAATVDAGSVHHPQASVGFLALLMRDQFLVGWAAKRSIRSERPNRQHHCSNAFVLSISMLSLVFAQA